MPRTQELHTSVDVIPESSKDMDPSHVPGQRALPGTTRSRHETACILITIPILGSVQRAEQEVAHRDWASTHTTLA